MYVSLASDPGFFILINVLLSTISTRDVKTCKGAHYFLQVVNRAPGYATRGKPHTDIYYAGVEANVSFLGTKRRTCGA